MAEVTEVNQTSTAPERPSTSEKHTATTDVDSTVEYRGERDESYKAHLRFLWVTGLVGCGLLEYGFDQGIIGSFQAMKGFLMVFGYEDPRVPTGWVSS